MLRTTAREKKGNQLMVLRWTIILVQVIGIPPGELLRILLSDGEGLRRNFILPSTHRNYNELMCKAPGDKINYKETRDGRYYSTMTTNQGVKSSPTVRFFDQ